MEHKSSILQFSSAAEARIIVERISRDKTLLPPLMSLFFSSNVRACQKAAWLVGLMAEKHPDLLMPYIPEMLKAIEEPIHDAVVRNTLRSWSFMQVAEPYEGQVYEACFTHVVNPTSPIAFRAHAMAACCNIALKYPDLLVELETTLKDVAMEEGKGVPARARKILQKIKKQKKEP